jgi:hypothetical protein
MKVIYSGCSNKVWLDVAQILMDQFDWQPCYWIGYVPWIEVAFRERFKQVPFHGDVAAVLGVPAPEFDQLRTAVLDQALLERLSVCELNAIKMMDRMDALGSFSYPERERHYRRLVAYWLAVLENLQPDLVFFVDIPHMVYDYVLYELCRMRNIPTLMFEASNILGLSYLRDTIDGDTVLVREYRRLLGSNNDQPVFLSQEIEDSLAALKGTYQDVPLYIRYVSQSDLHEKNDLRSIFWKLLDFKHYAAYIDKQVAILKVKLLKPPSYLKEAGKTPEESSVSNLGFRWFRFRAYRKMRTLDKYYHRLTTRKVELDRPYIYIALSYQPEATTSPKGNFYVNLELMVDMISHLVPQDWLLYVKEHPSQFERTWTHRAQSAREKYFFDDLAAMPNVRLIPTSFSSYDLVDNAVAVATVTGSVGWQAVNRLKPALVFGNPWYLGCEGVFSIREVADCEIALQTIQQGYQVDPHKIRVFAAALEKVGLKLDLESKTKKFQSSYVAAPGTIAAAMQTFFLMKRDRLDE